ncbi:MAG: M48 family metallopeptidase [Gammaproteobacteria bacterium]|jgi:predicted Zn-dependent protease|nr:M48 family metallopeptidase [Gammaproteobacteria bacterium]
MRNRLTAFFLAVVLANGCATSPTGRSQLLLMPDSEMDQMGLQAFTNIKKETPVETSPTTNSYVQCVGKAITREVGGSWEIVVFRDDAANAFALPGRKIGVNTGLLKVAENQHQLATVIGHEVAHVLSQHSNERVSQQFAVEQGLGLITAMASPRSATGQTLMGLLGVGAEYGILLPYSRIQESEADILGLDLMARAGFDPRESVKLWVNMGKAGGGKPPEFLSTHPSDSSRIRSLNARIPMALNLQSKALQAGKHPDCHQ